jgi:hypothetical protein
MSEFFIPSFKWQLVDFFFNHFKGKYTRTQLNKKNKASLYKWYFDVRNKLGR